MAFAVALPLAAGVALWDLQGGRIAGSFWLMAVCVVILLGAICGWFVGLFPVWLLVLGPPALGAAWVGGKVRELLAERWFDRDGSLRKPDAEHEEVG